MPLPHLPLDRSVDCAEVLDPAGVIVWMNDRRARLLSTSGTSVSVGCSWVALWPDSYRETAAAALSSALKRESARFTAPPALNSHTPMWWDVVVTPVLDRTGDVEALLSISRDVTSYVNACRDREDLLERERRARLELERENRRRDYALLVAAHELGAPLYAVRGWAQYLRLGNLESDEAAEAIDAISRNTDRQHHLVQRLLEVARFRSRRESFTLVANSIDDIVSDAIECVRAIASSKHITLESHVPTSAYVLADFDHLQRAFSNILFNSVKFTPPGGDVTVRCAADAERIRIEFADTGSGMDPAFLEHAFEPFSQETSTSEPAMVGLGLGLSIVRRIVEGHHGSVAVSSPGRGLGSTVVIELPAYPRTTV